MNFKNYFSENQKAINIYLKKLISDYNMPAKLKSAIKYSINANGKRLRPFLVLLVNDSINNKFKIKHNEDLMKIASSLEFIHTYSLIHDDLPAMDNDDYRRGKLTNHKVYGEGNAILAGDGLLTMAFETISDLKLKNINNYKSILKLISFCSGPNGMVGGQVIDLESENKNISFGMLKKIHTKKTGELLRASILSSVYYNNKLSLFNEFDEFAGLIGISFQIVDDVLDVISNTKVLGKPVGSDEEKGKSTYVKYFGVEKSKRMAKQKIDNAILILMTIKKKYKNFNYKYLTDISNYIINRIN